MHFSKIQTNRDYESLARYVVDVVNATKHDPILLKIMKDGLRNQIFDMRCIELGLVSEAAIATGKKKAELTKEHIYPRNQSAIRIMDAALNGSSIDDIREMIITSCQVVITTKEENMALVPFQRQEGYFWRDGYKAAGIKLVEYEFPTVHKYVYKVDGIEYNTCKEEAEANGCTVYAAQQRFSTKAKNSKFKGWTRHERVSQNSPASS